MRLRGLRVWGLEVLWNNTWNIGVAQATPATPLTQFLRKSWKVKFYHHTRPNNCGCGRLMLFTICTSKNISKGRVGITPAKHRHHFFCYMVLVCCTTRHCGQNWIQKVEKFKSSIIYLFFNSYFLKIEKSFLIPAFHNFVEYMYLNFWVLTEKRHFSTNFAHCETSRPSSYSLKLHTHTHTHYPKI